jgi:hypothetical protein
MKSLIKSKKGNVMNVIWIVVILFAVLLLGVLFAFGNMIINWTFDEATPTLTSLGMVGSSNLTAIGETTLNPLNSFVQAGNWLVGVVFVMALMGTIGMAFAFRFTGNKWLAGFFVMCVFLLIISSIFISNIYEEFYTGTNDVATRLHEQTMLSYLILYSPIVMCIVAFACGIIMFTGEGEEQTI